MPFVAPPELFCLTLNIITIFAGISLMSSAYFDEFEVTTEHTYNDNNADYIANSLDNMVSLLLEIPWQLSHCCLEISYCDINLGQHWLKLLCTLSLTRRNYVNWLKLSPENFGSYFRRLFVWKATDSVREIADMEQGLPMETVSALLALCK